MNNSRRKQIKEIVSRLDELKTQIEDIQSAEGDSRDNIPESLCDSEMYSTSEDASESLGSAVDSIDEAVSSLEECL